MFLIIFFFSFFSFFSFAENDCESLYAKLHRNFVILLEAESRLEDTQRRLENDPEGDTNVHRNFVILLEAENYLEEAENRFEASQTLYNQSCSDSVQH